ncbi:MAG: aspartate aminotransferase family protein [Chloroflexota bacterium]
MSEGYISRTPRSRELGQKAQQVYPGGVTYLIRHFPPYPFYVDHALGGRLYDIDGNEYTDYWMGHGALILGHCYPPIVKAIQEQAALGAHLGYSHPWEVEHAQQIVRMVPGVEMVRLTNSGTEANMFAARLARAYTGREKLAKFEGGWHGSYDALHTGVSWPLDKPDSAGIARGAQQDTVVLPFNDLEAAQRRLREVAVAGVVVEPVQGGAGCLPAGREFLAGLRQVCDETGALLIFDEVITGFRLAPGGGQELYGVTPDITVMGKIVGGGSLPAGAVGGRREVMALMDPTRFRQKWERVFHGGTYAGNPLVTRAGFVALHELDQRREEIYPYLNRLGPMARQGLDSAFREGGVEAHVTGVGSLVGVHFTREQPVDVRTANRTRDRELTARFFDYLLEHGIVFIGPHSAHLMLSVAPTEADIERLVEVGRGFARSAGNKGAG